MASLTRDDVKEMAAEFHLTADDIGRPVRPETMNAECNRCGTCCKMQNGILVTLDDIFRIAEQLDLKPADFVWKHCRDSHAYDIFGRGPFPGLSIATKDGVCPFYNDRAGCTVHEVKPFVCRLYPLNTVHVTRASLMKMQRMKDGPGFNDCYIFELPNNVVVLPDFAALAAYYVHMYVTRDYCARTGGQWHDELARKARDNVRQMASDKKLVAKYASQLRAAFEDLDRRNAEMLSGALLQ